MTIETRAIRSLAALEDAVTKTPLNRWETLLDADPTGTLFQSPVWCMPWYRSYEQFEPCLLMMTHGQDLVGVVPLAVEISTGRLTFCGDNMTDYRDVLTRPEFRPPVLGAFLEFYKRGGFTNVLHFGSTTPESESPQLLLSMARAFGVRPSAHQNYGWRWSQAEQKEDPMKSRSLRYKINCLKREGALEAQHIQSGPDWTRFKSAFYGQHTLRQIFGRRPVSFNSPEKRAFFDRLFETPYAHVTALWWKGELIAGHFGSVHREMLYWGAPSFDIRHRQYSPSLVLLALTMQRARDWGFSAIDFTIGEGDLKERMSTRRVDLPWVELYARPMQFHAREVRTAAVRLVRTLAERVGGEDAYSQRVKPVAERIALHARELGFAGTVARALGIGASKIGAHSTGIVFVARPEDLREVVAKLSPGETCAFHEDELSDLLKRDRWTDAAAREIGVKVRGFTEASRTGRTFHTLLVNDRLAAWGYSYWPTAPAQLHEVGGAMLEFEPHSVSLYDFYTLPEFRGRRLYQTLLTHILRKRFAEGAERAYISVLEKNATSKAAIERVGFRAITVNEFTRFLKWKKLRSRPA